MHYMIKATSLIATTTLWIAPAAVAIPLQPILAAPQLVLTDGLHAFYKNPGLGVEFELTTLTYASTKREWKDIDTAAKEELKGAELIPTGFAGGPQTNWKITAEISPANLMTEIIVDGRNNKVLDDGGDASRLIGQEIVQYMNGWSAFCGDEKGHDKKCYATVKPDPAGTNPWEVQWRQSIDQALFQPQVTAAMPMEGVLQVLKDGKAGTQADVLINRGQAYNQKIIVVTKDSFKPFLDIRPIDINDEFLGFFSLLISYCVAASEGEPAHGPKRGLNIMPRTNFLTMYNKFARDKLKELLKFSTSLYDIVRVIAALEPGRKLDIANMKFKWKPQDLRNPIDETWPGKDDDMKSGELTVKKFLDTLQPLPPDAPQLDLLMLMDRMVRHGQIGGYGDRMEGVYGSTNRPAPIFEFRDLENVNRANLADRMAAFNRQVVALHAKATGPTLDQQDSGQENNAKSEYQDQKLEATESTPPPAKQHNCEPET